MGSRRTEWLSGAAASAGLAFASLNSPAFAGITADPRLIEAPFRSFFSNRDELAPASKLVKIAAEAGTPSTGAAGPPSTSVGTPQPVSPVAQPPNAGDKNALPPQIENKDSPYLGLAALGRASASPDAPAWLIVPTAALDLIATDNIESSRSNKHADLIAQVGAGVSVSANTLRLQGVFTYSAYFRQPVEHTDQNRVAQFGAASVRATVVEDLFFFDASGNVQEVPKQGFVGTNTAVLSNSRTSQYYTLTGSPIIRTAVGRLGILDLRYIYSRVWFGRNTGPIVTPRGILPAVTDATQQQARFLFQMPGTLDARLSTDISASASSNETGGQLATFRKASAEVANEYQFNRSISVIAAGGYEALSNKLVPRINGQGATWQIGSRWRPTVDSSFLLLYGRHDLNTHFSEEIRWQITPLTRFYSAYTVSIANSQQMLMSNGASASFGSGSPSSGVTFDRDRTLALLNSPTPGFGTPSSLFGNSGAGVGFGAPLLGSGGYLPFQNDFFRLKSFNAGLQSNLFGEDVSLTVFHLQSISLTGRLPGVTTKGGYLAWNRVITQEITARAEIGYSRDNLYRGSSYTFGLSAAYAFSPTLDARARYDFLLREQEPGAFSFSFQTPAAQASAFAFRVNTLTLSLRKIF